MEIYRITKQFPTEERFGLTSQMRRSSASVPTNIAEGCGRIGPNELRRFMEMAMGSGSELEYQLLLASDLDYLPKDIYWDLHNRTIEVKKMLSSFINKLR